MRDLVDEALREPRLERRAEQTDTYSLSVSDQLLFAAVMASRLTSVRLNWGLSFLGICVSSVSRVSNRDVSVQANPARDRRDAAAVDDEQHVPAGRGDVPVGR